MRSISFARTVLPLWRREKTVTRRLGWKKPPKPGELLRGIVQGQGLAKGQTQELISIIGVTSVRRERLSAVTKADVVREGFPGMSRAEFIRMFCELARCTPSEKVLRIEFRFVSGGRFPVAGICRQCGCSEYSPCHDEHGMPCWWVGENGQGVLDQSTLCSHCFHGFERGPSDHQIAREMEMA